MNHLTNHPLNCSTAQMLNFLPSPLYICRESSTNSPLFMQNKPNLLNTQMNVTSLITVDYENIADWTLGENKPNSKPIYPYRRGIKPNLVRRPVRRSFSEDGSLGEGGTNPIRWMLKCPPKPCLSAALPAVQAPRISYGSYAPCRDIAPPAPP